MNKLFQLQIDELRHAVLANMEKRLNLVIKYALLFVALLVVGIIRPDLLRWPPFYVYLGILIFGTLTYTYLYRRFLSTHRVVIMTFSSCLETLFISFIYCAVAGEHLEPIVFLFLSLPILRLILFYPSVPEFILAASSSSSVFLIVTLTLSREQLALPLFWVYFVSMWLIYGLGIAIANELFNRFNQSAKNRHLILQALQMVSSLIEMAELTAHLREESEIFQRSVEIISRIMSVDSCVAWIYKDGKLYPAASEGLDEEQEIEFQKMELSIRDIPIFNHALTQKEPIVAADGDLEEAAPLHYRQCFGINAILVIPLMDDKRTLGCTALHWRTPPEHITSQELAILSGIATQTGITLENVYLLEELRRKEEIRGRLLERVISIQEAERERIARELHDETGQILTALMVNVELLRTEPEFQSAKSQERLDEISSLLSKTLEDIHNLSLDLHPKMLKELGLVSAIRWYMKNHLERWGISFNIVADNLNHALSAKEELCLFRVTQEAITNVIRHAQAQRVDVEIGVDAESVYLSVKDDGRGFDTEDVLSSSRGDTCLGLRSMRERVSFLGGLMDIKSQIEEGTEISVNVPLSSKDVTTDAEDTYSPG